MTSLVCEIDVRELAKSRCASRGAGATTVAVAGEFADLNLSRETSGAGPMRDGLSVGALREFTCATSGAGGMTVLVMPVCVRLRVEFTSGEG